MKSAAEILKEKTENKRTLNIIPNSPLHKAVLEAMEAYAQQSATVEGKEWIKSSERMPEHNIGVLVFIPNEDFHITAGMWDVSNKWVLLDEYREPDCEVSHWMELPIIPIEYQKEEKENQKIMQFIKDNISTQPAKEESPAPPEHQQELLSLFYTGELNTERIKTYLKLSEVFNLSEGAIREIFCSGIDFAANHLQSRLTAAEARAEEAERQRENQRRKKSHYRQAWLKGANADKLVFYLQTTNQQLTEERDRLKEALQSISDVNCLDVVCASEMLKTAKAALAP